jgi:hypothetical protein
LFQLGKAARGRYLRPRRRQEGGRQRQAGREGGAKGWAGQRREADLFVLYREISCAFVPQVDVTVTILTVRAVSLGRPGSCILYPGRASLTRPFQQAPALSYSQQSASCNAVIIHASWPHRVCRLPPAVCRLGHVLNLVLGGWGLGYLWWPLWYFVTLVRPMPNSVCGSSQYNNMNASMQPKIEDAFWVPFAPSLSASRPCPNASSEKASPVPLSRRCGHFSFSFPFPFPFSSALLSHLQLHLLLSPASSPLPPTPPTHNTNPAPTLDVGDPSILLFPLPRSPTCLCLDLGRARTRECPSSAIPASHKGRPESPAARLGPLC